LDYVRRQDYERTVAAGAAAVIAKPLLTYDLLWHLGDLTGQPRFWKSQRETRMVPVCDS
jgi:hypothetical protein